MKIKVQCNCGTRFEFEVEPVNERMPVPITCPGCNVDATGLANDVIKAQLAAAKTAPAPATPAPAPAAPAIPALKIPTAASAPQAPSIPTAAPAPAPASPSIPAVRLPTPPAANPAPVATPVIPAQPAAPSPTPAPRPVMPAQPVVAAAAPAPATAPVSPPQGGLRINKAASAHTAPSAPQPAQAAPTGSSANNKCPKHPTEDPVETCRVCNKPMCKKCMEMFGYVCSVYCRNQANARKMDIPVYAHQKSVVHERSEGKARIITYAVVGLIFLLLGGWIWFEWWGSAPKVVYRIKFAKKEPRGLHHLIGPGELLSIKDKQMTLFDVAHQKQVWTTPIKTENAAPAAEEKITGKTNSGIKIRATDKNAVKAEVASKVVKEKLPAASEDSSSSMSNDDNEDFFSYRDFMDIKQVIPTETDIWILFHDRLAQFDRKTGSPKQDIAFKREVIHVSRDQNGILAVSMPDKNHRVLTQIALPSGTVQTEEIDLTPAKPKANEKANDKTKKPVATVVKKAVVPVANPSSADGEGLDEPDYFSSPHDNFVSAGANVVEMKTKLLERKVEVREAMKAKTTSILDSANMNASRSLDAAEELLNDMQRQDTGGKVQEDVSRYEVTVHRLLAKGIPDWTGEIIGPPTIYPLKTVDVVAGGRSIIVLDKNNKKLWDSKLTYPVGTRSSFSFDFDNGSELPCLETSDTLYFADQGMLSSFDLSNGAPRWRVTSVGISKIQLDEKGNVYLTTTTATPDTIQYSKQVNLKNRPEPVIMKIDAKTGKKLWEVVKIGEELLISGKYIYAGKVSTMMVALRLEDGPDYHYNFYRLKPASGKVDWNYFQTKPGSHAEVNKNWILIEFRDEIQVLKFLSF